MGRFVEGADRSQLTLLSDCLEDWVSEDKAVHVVDAFVEALDLHRLGLSVWSPRRRAGPAIIQRSF